MDLLYIFWLMAYRKEAVQLLVNNGAYLNILEN